MEKTMAKESLRSLIGDYSEKRVELMNSKTHYNESQARLDYIDPFLELLGWDVGNKSHLNYTMRDTVVESYVTPHSRPDYMLRRNGTTMIVVEAEKPSKNLNEDLQPAQQVLEYGWLSGTKIGLLFNVETLQIFQTTANPINNDKIAAYRSYSYAELLDNFDDIWLLLSKESVNNGDMETAVSKFTPKSAAKHMLDNAFLQALNSWRLLIAKDLIESDADYKSDIDRLNNDIEIFLNQIIFLRFAEDNNLERTITLENIVKEGTGFAESLRILDKKYNSGIFEESNIADRLSQDTVHEIIRGLYYPVAAYNFAVIDLQILGKIYENFLLQQIVIKAGKPELSFTNDSSNKAVVSTPIELTKLITNFALQEKLMSMKTIDEVLNLRVLDMAAGSGTFLVASYDQIEGRIIDLIVAETHEQPESTTVPLEIKKEIISKVLHGNDVDDHATMLTRFSLALRLLRNESSSRIMVTTPIVPSMKSNITSFNSIISNADIAKTVENQKLSDWIGQVEKIRPGDWGDCKFDVILGNPPYRKSADMKEHSALELKTAKEVYASAKGQFDEYFLFIERGLKLLAEDGQLTMITPNKFMFIDAGKALRNILVKGSHVRQITDFGPTQLFNDKLTYVAIFSLTNQPQKKIEYRELTSIRDADSVPYEEYAYKDLSIANGPWLFSSDKKVVDVYRLLTQLPSIVETFDVQNGVQTSANDVYLIPENSIDNITDEIIEFSKGKGDNVHKFVIEKDIVKPFYKKLSDGLSTYSKLPKNHWIIFPYIDGKLISPSIMESDYPRAYAYLQMFKQRLSERNMNNLQDNAEWYMYGRSQAFNIWNRPKLVVTVNSNHPIVAIDFDNTLLASGGTAGNVPIFSKPNSVYSLEYLQAWLNFPIVDDMFKMLSSYFDGGFWTHGTTIMKKVPFLTLNFKNKKQVDLYKQIVDDVTQINGLPTSKVAERSILIQLINSRMNELLKLRLEDLDD